MEPAHPAEVTVTIEELQTPVGGLFTRYRLGRVRYADVWPEPGPPPITYRVTFSNGVCRVGLGLRAANRLADYYCRHGSTHPEDEGQLLRNDALRRAVALFTAGNAAIRAGDRAGAVKTMGALSRHLYAHAIPLETVAELLVAHYADEEAVRELGAVTLATESAAMHEELARFPEPDPEQ